MRHSSKDCRSSGYRHSKPSTGSQVSLCVRLYRPDSNVIMQLKDPEIYEYDLRQGSGNLIQL